MTIEAKELRIGNYVWMCIPRLNDKMIIRDHRVHSTDIVHQENGSTLLEPIPLTEEWLVRLGFEKVKDINENSYPDWKTKGMLLHSNVNGNYVLGNHTPICFLNHVHQLQNLYFALTGNELKITT